MCRLFGFRSVIKSQVHRSLLSADNALSVQSRAHPDGWGVAYYVGDSPHLIKSADTAMSSPIFQRVSGVVSSETVVAHIRRATQGQLSPLNAHPFQHGRWIFAHNGNIARFSDYRPELLTCLSPHFRRFVLGDTDSELFFFLILTHLERRHTIHTGDIPFDTLKVGVIDALEELQRIVGPYRPEPLAGGSDETYLTFILTNGRQILAHHGGQPLFFSTYKSRCSERDTCPSFGSSCEAPIFEGAVNHLILSSEPLQGENHWEPMSAGQIVGTDERMRLRVIGGSAGPMSI